jgi:chromosome partitioning protein
MVIAVTNQKGGCAKTTTAVNLATALSTGDVRSGFPAAKVLLIDLDPQGSVSTSFGISKNKLGRSHTVYDLLMDESGEQLNVSEDFLIHPDLITDCMQEAWRKENRDKKPPKQLKVENLWLLPSNMRLAGAEIELAMRIGRETRLKEALSEVIEEFDYIIIDTPPTLGLLTINALAAANWTLIPVQTEYYALEGMSQLMNSIKLIQRRINPHLKVFGIALTMFQKSKLCEMVSDEVRRKFEKQVFKTVVPRNIAVAEAPASGAPVVLLHKPTKSNRGSQAYWALSREVHKRVNQLRRKWGIKELSRLKLHQM